MIRTSKVSLVLTLSLTASIFSSASSIASFTSEDEGDEEKSFVPYHADRSNLKTDSLGEMGCDILGVGEAFLFCSSVYSTQPPVLNNDASKEERESKESRHWGQPLGSTSAQAARQSFMSSFGCLPLINSTLIYELAREGFIHLPTPKQESGHEDADAIMSSMNDSPAVFWSLWDYGYFSPLTVSSEKKNQ